MGTESIIVRELEKERSRNQDLELEIINLNCELKAYQPHPSYPRQINACLADVNRYLTSIRKVKQQNEIV